MSTAERKNNIIKMTTIGVKSIGQILVGIISFIFLYKGSMISEINFGLIFIQNMDNQDKTTSAKTIYLIISKNIIIPIKRVIFICLFY